MVRRSFVQGLAAGAVVTVVMIVAGQSALTRWVAPRIIITNSGRLPLRAVKVAYRDDHQRESTWMPGELDPGETATLRVLCSDLFCTSLQFQLGNDCDTPSGVIICDADRLATPLERIELFLDERGLVQVQGPRPRLPQP